jgi:hypothetical protein
MAQSSCFNQTIQKKIVWKNILKNPNDAMCCIYKLPHVNKLLVCIVVASVVANTIA